MLPFLGLDDIQFRIDTQDVEINYPDLIVLCMILKCEETYIIYIFY